MQGEPNRPQNRQRRKSPPGNCPESRFGGPLAGQGMLFYKALGGHIGRHLDLPEPFPDSSMVEQPAVNRFVVGSSPTRGAFVTERQCVAIVLNPLQNKGFFLSSPLIGQKRPFVI